MTDNENRTVAYITVRAEVLADADALNSDMTGPLRWAEGLFCIGMLAIAGYFLGFSLLPGWAWSAVAIVALVGAYIAAQTATALRGGAAGMRHAIKKVDSAASLPPRTRKRASTRNIPTDPIKNRPLR